MFMAGRVTALVLLAVACGFAIAHWRADLVETRRRARAVFVGMMCALFAALAASDFVFGPGGVAPGWLALGHVALLAFSFAALQIVARGGLDELLSVPDTVPAAPRLTVIGADDGPDVAPRPASVTRRNDGAEIALARRVTAAMETDRLWKREAARHRGPRA